MLYIEEKMLVLSTKQNILQYNPSMIILVFSSSSGKCDLRTEGGEAEGDGQSNS